MMPFIEKRSILLTVEKAMVEMAAIDLTGEKSRRFLKCDASTFIK
jgi:hypothetical protein